MIINFKIRSFGRHLFSAQENEQALHQAIADIETTIEYLKEKNQQQFRLLDAKKNEYNLTKSMVDNLEGFPESSRFLRKNQQWDKHVPFFLIFCFVKKTIELRLKIFLNLI